MQRLGLKAPGDEELEFFFTHTESEGRRLCLYFDWLLDHRPIPADRDWHDETRGGSIKAPQANVFGAANLS